MITFEELRDMQRNEKDLPKIASYNEKTSKVIHQRPAEVIDHGVLSGDLIHLGLRESETDIPSSLQATPEHPMLVERLGERMWITAGDLAEGDQLVSSDGRLFNYDSEISSIFSDETALYNLSFASAEGTKSPTYLVSQDGVNWVVAHNLK